MTTRIGLTGDVMLGRTVDEHQRRRSVDAVWGDLRESLRGLDGLLINLECCLSTRGRPWPRRPFHFRADPDWATAALEDVGVDCCALANNHVLDFGTLALRDTLEELEEAGIAHAGAGETLEEALEPAVFDVEGLTIAVVSFTDNVSEYAASEDSPGTAYIDIDVENEQTRRRVSAGLERARGHDPDLIIASLHWGPNMVERPPESFEDFGRWLVDRGVDVVHGHSAHVFHGIEVYDGAPILYDTGDFVDDYAVDPDLRNDRSFLFELEVTDDGRPVKLRLTPVEIDDCAVHEAIPGVAEWSRERMRSLSATYGTTFDRDSEDLLVDLEAAD